MRSENGIPRPFQPNNLAQELRDLKRKVAQLEARRTFVSVERIVEGGTINENVGKQLAETVQKDIQLTADQVAIGEAGNLERDPNFEQPNGWESLYLSDPTVTRHIGGGYNGANAISFPATDSEDEVSGVWRYNEDGRFNFPVEAGSNYRVSCWVQPDKDIPAQGVALFLRASTPDGGFWGVEVEESAQNAVPIRAGEWARITGIVTMPGNATSAFLGYFRFASSNDVVVRYSTPTVQAALSQELLGDGFFKGLRVIGASVETNEAPETGLKMNDAGLTAHGRADETVGNGTKIAHRVRAALANRRSQRGVSDTDLWPGVWFESEPAQYDTRTRPKWPAHVTVSDALAYGVVTRSSMLHDTASYSESGVSPMFAYISVNKDAASTGGPRANSYLGLFPDRFRLTVSDASGATLAGLESDPSNNSLNVTSPGGTLVNGRPLLPTAIGGMPAGGVPKQIIGDGSATTTSSGVFTVTYADLGFSTKAAIILVTPTSGTAGYPVVNGGRLYKDRAEMVIPSAPNTRITYSYIAIGY